MDSNLSSIDLDPGVRQAYEVAKDTKTITPILKEELKLTILSRRYKSGKGEINLDEKKPVIKRELTDEEIKKKLRRKEQNRRAAERCRIKKKKLNDQLTIEFVNEQRRSNQLAAEVETLKKEKEMLKKILEEHTFTCARAVTPSPSYDDSTSFTYTYPVPGIPNEIPVPFGRDTATPFGDPFDDYPHVNQEFDNLMYPGMQFPNDNDLKGLYPSCTMAADDFPEVQVPDDFSELMPVSPEMVPGRQSISEYIDEDILNI